MSLVEQASKRLEELRRAGVDLSGELAYPAHPTVETQVARASTIERALTRIGAGGERDKDLFAHGQDEDGRAKADVPVLQASDRGQPVPSAPSSTASLARASRRIELDFAMLASRGYLTPNDPESGLANQFRKVKWPLIQACQGKAQPPVKNANRIMLTSSVPGEGKSFIALNLALSIATERDHTVLLIDADTTRPSLSHLLQISSEFGLLDLLSGGDGGIPRAILRTNVEKLSVMPAGIRRPHATELLASEAMAEMIRELASRYADRILIFDTPPLLAAPEPAVLASYMGQILVVAEADRTTQERLKSALATIESCPVVRMLLNKAPKARERYSYAG